MVVEPVAGACVDFANASLPFGQQTDVDEMPIKT
jgi:hypothetical protein